MEKKDKKKDKSKKKDEAPWIIADPKLEKMVPYQLSRPLNVGIIKKIIDSNSKKEDLDDEDDEQG